MRVLVRGCDGADIDLGAADLLDQVSVDRECCDDPDRVRLDGPRASLGPASTFIRTVTPDQQGRHYHNRSQHRAPLEGC